MTDIVDNTAMRGSGKEVKRPPMNQVGDRMNNLLVI